MTSGEMLLYKLVEGNKLQEFGRLKPEWLTKEERALYNQIYTFVKKYGRLPRIIDVNFKVDSPIDMPYEFYYDELTERHLAFELDSLGEKLSAMTAEGKHADAFTVMEEFVYDMKKSLMVSRDLYTSSASLLETVLEKIPEYRLSDGLIGVPTGWPTLDHTTRGFQPKNLYIILARPKMGKSIVMMNMAASAFAADRKVMVVSMEMAALEMARRMLGIMLSVPAAAFKSGKVSHFCEMRIRNLLEDLRSRPPFYFLEGQFRKTVAELTSLVHALKPDIVFVDGGYLLKAVSNSRAQKWEKMAEIAEDLKTLSMVAGIPLVVSFQFNRKVKSEDSKTAGWETVHLSDAIAQIASVGIGIFTAGEGSRRRRKVEVIGGREGEEGCFEINWDWDKMDFSERRPREVRSNDQDDIQEPETMYTPGDDDSETQDDDLPPLILV